MATTGKEVPKGVTTRLNTDGVVNPKYVDVLDEDKPIAGQKFACLSFISPEKVLEEKNTYYFKQFLKRWDMQKSLEKYTQFLNFVSFKHDVSFDTLTKDLEEFVKEEKNNLFTTSLEDDYKTFIDNNEEEDARNRNKDENNNLSPMRRSSSGSSNNSTTNDNGNIYDDLTTSNNKNNGTSNSMSNNNTNNTHNDNKCGPTAMWE